MLLVVINILDWHTPSLDDERNLEFQYTPQKHSSRNFLKLNIQRNDNLLENDNGKFRITKLKASIRKNNIQKASKQVLELKLNRYFDFWGWGVVFESLFVKNDISDIEASFEIEAVRINSGATVMF